MKNTVKASFRKSSSKNIKSKKNEPLVGGSDSDSIDSAYAEDSDNADAEHEENESEDEAEGGEGGEEKDGMADMMSKILNQNVSSSNPILAKRKTAIMKEMEEGKEDNERLKRLRAQRKSEREKQLAAPDAGTADYENQLRKLATRGVISLFNAISSSKRDEVEAENALKAKNAEEGKEISRVDIKKLTQANFLELLKSDESHLKSSISHAVSSSSSSSINASASTAARSEPPKGLSWMALREDYLLNHSEMRLKNWDKEIDGFENDGNNDEGGIDLDDVPLAASGAKKANPNPPKSERSSFGNKTKN